MDCYFNEAEQIQWIAQFSWAPLENYSAHGLNGEMAQGNWVRGLPVLIHYGHISESLLQIM